jgi:hypothetical protein
MEELDINYYMKICFDNNVKIYPIILDMVYMKIQVDYAGRKKTGTEKYDWRLQQKQMQEKIIELYETIGKNIQSRG